MRAYDGLIFDLDGTLWDSTSAVAEAWDSVSRDLGIRRARITERDIASIMGLTLPEAFDRLFPGVTGEKRKQLEKVGEPRELRRLLEKGGLLYAGVREGLEKLSASYPLFLVSNCMEDYLEAFFMFSGLRDRFRDCETYGRTQKPKAHNIRLVVERNGLTQAAYIGDTAGDESAARAAGVEFFHAAYGFGVPDRECVAFSDFQALTKFFVSMA